MYDYTPMVLKRSQGKKLYKAKDHMKRVHSDQMVLRMVRWEAEPHGRWPKALKAKLSQGGPSGSNPLRSDLVMPGGGWGER
jgi:hypothetical protein